mgnify:FL=1
MWRNLSVKLTLTTDFMTLSIYDKKSNNQTICNDLCFNLEGDKLLEMQTNELWHNPLISLDKDTTISDEVFHLNVYDTVGDWRLNVVDEDNPANNIEYTNQLLSTIAPTPFVASRNSILKNIVSIEVNKDIVASIVGTVLCIYAPIDLYDIYYEVNIKALNEANLQLRYYGVASYSDTDGLVLVAAKPSTLFDTRISEFILKKYRLDDMDFFMETHKSGLRAIKDKENTYHYYGSTQVLKDLFLCMNVDNPTSKQKISLFDIIKFTFNQKYTLKLDLSNVKATIKVDKQKLFMEFTPYGIN